jgi:hypothetical protein
MTDFFGSSNMGKLSRKAQQGRREYEEILKYEQRAEDKKQIDFNIKDLQLQIIEEKKDFYRNIFLESLEQAVEDTGEYDRKRIFSENIEVILTQNIMDFLAAIVTYGAYGVYDIMDETAGDIGDFWEGVENARELLDVSRGDKGRAARFWENKVWPSDEMYDDTIALRFQIWGDKAPYWYFLEHGNYASTYAHPKFTQTNFLSHSAYRIIEDLEIEVAKRKEASEEESPEEEEINRDYSQKEINLFDNAQAEFLSNPDSYQPGYVFNKYRSLEDECEYKIYLTKTKQIGRRKIR